MNQAAESSVSTPAMMKIVLINYRYFVSGGPERYMFALADLLEQAGHQVVPFSVGYALNRQTPWSPYFAAPIAGDDEVYFRNHTWSPRSVARGLQRAFYAPDVYENLRRLVDVAAPDVAFVQHYLRKLSPSVLVALKDAGVPIVVRLSDYGMVCPEAHLLRRGRVCRLCIERGLWSSITHRCVQDSYLVSAVACASLAFAKWRRYFDLVDYFVSPSATLRDEMVLAGYDPCRIVVLPTFVAADAQPLATRSRSIVYVGRISPEKGIDVLVDAYERMTRHPDLADIELIVAGEGGTAYSQRVVDRAQRTSPGIRFLGGIDGHAVRKLLASALISVVPSLSLENLPNALLESLAVGTPVIASDLGSMHEVLWNTGAGVLFPPGDSEKLAEHLTAALRSPDKLAEMGASARLLAKTRYEPQLHLKGLTDLLRMAQGGQH